MNSTNDVPLFSIVVPIYNSETFIKECLDSISSQSFFNYEVILINDGSADKSGAICEETAKKDQRFKVFHQMNQGQLSARINGALNATGQYLVFLDSDDMLKKDALETLKECINNYNPDIIIFNSSIDKQFHIPYRKFFFSKFFFDTKDIIEIKKAACSSNAMNNMAFKCIKTALISCDKDFSSFYWMRNGEDLIQSFFLIDKASSVFFLDSILYYYRHNPQSVTHTFNLQEISSLKTAERQRRDYSLKWSDSNNKLTIMAEMCTLVNLSNVILKILKSNIDYKIKKEMLTSIESDSFFVNAMRNACSSIHLKEYIVLSLVFKRKIKTLLFLQIMLSFLRKIIPAPQAVLSSGADD